MVISGLLAQGYWLLFIFLKRLMQRTSVGHKPKASPLPPHACAPCWCCLEENTKTLICSVDRFSTVARRMENHLSWFYLTVFLFNMKNSSKYIFWRIKIWKVEMRRKSISPNSSLSKRGWFCRLSTHHIKHHDKSSSLLSLSYSSETLIMWIFSHINYKYLQNF